MYCSVRSMWIELGSSAEAPLSYLLVRTVQRRILWARGGRVGKVVCFVMCVVCVGNVVCVVVWVAVCVACVGKVVCAAVCVVVCVVLGGGKCWQSSCVV